jgi:hypothetical protein
LEFGQQKSPGPFQAGLRFEDVALASVYARTPPEARQGLVVLVVHLVAVNIARTIWAEGTRVNGPCDRIVGANEVESRCHLKQ